MTAKMTNLHAVPASADRVRVTFSRGGKSFSHVVRLVRGRVSVMEAEKAFYIDIEDDGAAVWAAVNEAFDRMDAQAQAAAK